VAIFFIKITKISILGMFTSGSPPYSYFQRAKNLFGAIFMVYWMDRHFIQPLTVALKPILGNHYDAYVKFASKSVHIFV